MGEVKAIEELGSDRSRALNHLYIEMDEGKYIDAKNRPMKHIWITPYPYPYYLSGNKGLKQPLIDI